MTIQNKDRNAVERHIYLIAGREAVRMHNLRNQLLGVVARAKALRVGLAMSCIAVLALPVVAVGGQAAQPPRPPRPPVRSLPAGVERPSLGRIRVPYPNSLVPQQVIANVQKIVTSIRLDEVSGI